jgi:hypothetical protein
MGTVELFTLCLGILHHMFYDMKHPTKPRCHNPTTLQTTLNKKKIILHHS